MQHAAQEHRGPMSFIKSQLVEIIEWTDDSRDTLAYRFPDEDKEIKRGAQLVVRESQKAQFVYLGQFGDLFGPGRRTLTTDNIPVLTRLRGWKYGFESPFKADVYYVVTRLFTGNKWGTSNPVMVRDQDFGVVRLRAFGTYDFRVVDVPRFLKEVAGTDGHYRLDDFADAMRSRIVSVFSNAVASSKIPALDIATRYTELGEALLPLINPVLKEKYGLEMASFILENVSVPPDVEQALDTRAGMAAVVVSQDFDLIAFRQHLAERLPEYARPLFLRILGEIETTATFKPKKQDLSREGYDPVVTADAIYFNDRVSRSFVKVDAVLYEQLRTGNLRL